MTNSNKKSHKLRNGLIIGIGVGLVALAIFFLEYTELFKTNSEANTWGSDEIIYVEFSNQSISASNNSGITISDTVLTIKSAGTYQLSGTLDDGRVIISAARTDGVKIYLDNVSINCSDAAPLFVKKAGNVEVTLLEGIENYLSDGATYKNSTEADAALFADSSLSIRGEGYLEVTANHDDGIASTGNLIIDGANISVVSVGDGVRGKDSVRILDADLNVTATDDAIKTTNVDNETKGTVEITNSNLALTTKSNTATSAKGIKATTSISIDGGTYAINSVDDCIHAANITIKNGDFSLTTKDDGIHADDTLNISGGNIAVLESYEGLEATTINISGGSIDIVATDDGINAAGGTDSANPNPGGHRGPDRFSGSTGTLNISGGTIVVDSSGDGLDSNGDINITGGSILIDGPISPGDGAVDRDGTLNISGGDQSCARFVWSLDEARQFTPAFCYVQH